MYTLTLSNGIELQNLTRNGSCFISTDMDLTERVFEYNLRQVTLSDGESQWNYRDLVLVMFEKKDTEVWFSFRELSSMELQMEALRADLDYVAMLTGITLISENGGA